MTTPDQQRQIEQALAKGEKIEAIRICREATGKGLKEAKEEVEALAAELLSKDPLKYQALTAKGSGCASTIVLGLGVGAALATLTERLLF